MAKATKGHGMSERQACRLVGQHRSTQRRPAEVPSDEPALIRDMRSLSGRFPRYGYRRVHRCSRGWAGAVNAKRVRGVSAR